MAVLIRKTGVPSYPEELVEVAHDEMQEMLKRGEAEHVENQIYRQTAKYATKVMTPAAEPVEDAEPADPGGDAEDAELAVGCDSCGAEPGDPCVTASGNAKTDYHKARRDAAAP